MSVKISKLWDNAKFSKLPNNAKLLYIYLATNPGINSVGVICLETEMIMLKLKFSLDEVRDSTRSLIDSNYVKVEKDREDLYFIVIDHFNSLPKSDSTVMKVNKDIKSLPNKVVVTLAEWGISSDRKVVQFSKPDVTEVNEYALSQGYMIDGQSFIDYYENEALKFGKTDIWVDSRGKQVKDWKGKLRKVWFKEDRKMEACKGAPKGYEYFYIESNGKMRSPDGWRDGKPFSKDFVLNKELQRAYEERKKGS